MQSSSLELNLKWALKSVIFFAVASNLENLENLERKLELARQSLYRSSILPKICNATRASFPPPTKKKMEPNAQRGVRPDRRLRSAWHDETRASAFGEKPF